MKQLKNNCQKVWTCLGSPDIFNLKNRPGREHARSLYIVCDVEKGELANQHNIRSIRPGYGLSPDFYDQVLGKTFKQNFKAGTALKWEYLL